MKRLSLWTLLAAAALATPMGFAWGQAVVPGTIAFTARIADNGAPATGNHLFVFELYDAASGGSLVWDEPATTLAVEDGLLAYELGTATPLDATVLTGGKLWLAMSIDGTPLTPRLPIASVPYAIRAARAATADNALALGGVRASEYLTTGSRATIEGWAGGVCYDSEAELTALLNDNYAATSHTHGSAGIDAGAVTAAKLANCTSVGQIYKYTAAGTWSCANDSVGDITDLTAGTGITVTNGTTANPTISVSTGGITNAQLASGIDAAKITTGTLPGSVYDAYADMLAQPKLARGSVYVTGGGTTFVSLGTTISAPYIIVTPVSPTSGVSINTYCTVRDVTNTDFYVTCMGNTAYVHWVALW